jgi:hypothetical protein
LKSVEFSSLYVSILVKNIYLLPHFSSL